jgi:hypothetical protein
MTNEKNPRSLQLNEFLGEWLVLILNLREFENKTFKEIGQLIGRSRSQAMVLYRRAKQRQEDYKAGEKENPYFMLSFRSANICENAGLKNRSQIEDAINTGHLHPKSKFFRNYGWKSHIEIHQWLGLPIPQQDRPRLKVCPHCQGKL